MGVWTVVERVDRLTRIHFVGYSAMWSLLGAATSSSSPIFSIWIGLVLIGASFHIFGSLQNDIVDLPIDRTQPSRTNDPLVQGTISIRSAILIVIVQVPLMLTLSSLLGASGTAQCWLIGALGSMTIYNFFGKRCAVPPVTDTIQGCAWACMAIYGAELAGGNPNKLTLLVALSAICYTALINGVHGGMRDLVNDRKQGAQTTALWLGMTERDTGELQIPTAAHLYCWPLQISLLVIAIWLLLAQASAGWIAGVSMICVSIGCLWGMYRVLQPSKAHWGLIFRLHLIGLLVPLLIAVLSQASAHTSVGIVGLFVVPMALIDYPRRALLSAVNEAHKSQSLTSSE